STRGKIRTPLDCETSSRALGATSYSRFSAASARWSVSARFSALLCCDWGTVVVQAVSARPAAAMATATQVRDNMIALNFMVYSRYECWDRLLCRAWRLLRVRGAGSFLDAVPDFFHFLPCLAKVLVYLFSGFFSWTFLLAPGKCQGKDSQGGQA